MPEQMPEFVAAYVPQSFFESVVECDESVVVECERVEEVDCKYRYYSPCFPVLHHHLLS